MILYAGLTNGADHCKQTYEYFFEVGLALHCTKLLQHF